MTIGEYLKNARNDKTLGQISMISGIDKGYLSKIERGERTPKTNMLVRLADAYGVDYSELLLLHDQETDSAEREPDKEILYFSILRSAKKKNIPPEDLKKIIDAITDHNDK